MNIKESKKIENRFDLKKLLNPQIGIWEGEMAYPNEAQFNYAASVKFKDKINCELLEKAINISIQKNDGLRIHLVEQNGTAMQYFVPYKYKKIDVVDLSGYDDKKVKEWMQSKVRIPFKMIDSDLHYFAIIKTQNDGCTLLIKVHHLLMDAWALFNIFLNKLFWYYKCLENGVEINDDVPSYREYIDKAIINEEKYEKSDEFIANRDYWRNTFSTVPGMTCLKPGVESLASDRKVFELSAELSEKIKNLSKTSGCSPFVIFMSALSIYLGKIMNEEDVVINSAALNRFNQKEKETFGMFVNTYPVRIKIDSNRVFSSYIYGVKQQWKNVLINQKYTIERISEDYKKMHKTAGKLNDVALSYQNVTIEHENVRYNVDKVLNGSQLEALKIHISDREAIGVYKFELEYRLDAFTETEIENTFKRLVTLLEDTLDNPDKTVDELNIVPEEEKQQILGKFNDTSKDYPKGKTLHELFEEQVEKDPDGTAVVFNGTNVTYKELNEKSNMLARVLRKNGVKPDSLVGIMIDRSPEMIISILGVLKAGGAYLPIDPEYPKDRINYMLKHGTKILITSGDKYKEVYEDSDIYVIDALRIPDAETSNLENVSNPQNLAYVIYTSGSTGKPKGVMVKQAGVCNLAYWLNENLQFKKGKSILALTTICFDMSVPEVLIPFLLGMKIVLANTDEQKEPAYQAKLIKENNINILQTTPSRIRAILSIAPPKTFDSVKVIMIGGEDVQKDLVAKIRETVNANTKIYDLYGPTETTVLTTGKDVTKDNINIGRPISNTRAFIVNKNNNLNPVGVPGELCIAGDGLARGYLKRPDLTSERFIDAPFLKDTKMYKTGDLVKWLPNGEIEYLGRIDNQVKIRGFRVELGEIEACLCSIKSVKQAAVAIKDNYLCAYMIADEHKPVFEIKEFLADKLPYYMVPSYFQYVDSIPLSQSGKVDKKALPEPDINTNIGIGFVEPKSNLEKTIAAVWKKILEIDKIGTHDDFFKVGGDSLQALKLSIELKQCSINMRVLDINENRTIARQAAFVISKQGENSFKEIKNEESAVESISSEKIATGTFKLLESVVENTDSYSWEQLNCFFKPLAIMYDSFMPGYFDIFLFVVSYYCTHMPDGWFTNSNQDNMFDTFFDFHKNVVEPKTGLSFKCINYKNKIEMIELIKKSIKDNSPVLIPADLYELYYTLGYRRYHHRHYVIVKGFDDDREIFQVLDNMQIENGANTVYNDYVIKYDDLFRMGKSYRDAYDSQKNNPYFFTISTTRDIHKEHYTLPMLLKDYLLHIQAINAGKIKLIHVEAEFLRRTAGGKTDIEEARYLLGLINFKDVYYDILNKLLKNTGSSNDGIEKAKEFEDKLNASWKEIKMEAFNAAGGTDVNLDAAHQKIEAILSLESTFRNNLEKELLKFNLDSLIENEKTKGANNLFIAKNHKKAEIKKENGKYIFNLSSCTAYDTWDIADNAPQLLAYPEENRNFEIETKVKINGNINGPYQSGLIIYLKRGIKLMLCLDKGFRISLFCPEKGDNYTLYTVNYSENAACFRIVKESSLLKFYWKKHKSDKWEMKYKMDNCSDVSSCGIFAKTFEKVNFSAEFSHLSYIAF